MTTPEADSAQSTPNTHGNGSTPTDNTKPVTIALPEDTLRKLRVIAIVKESSVSELIAEAAASVVKRELRKALSKISGD